MIITEQQRIENFIQQLEKNQQEENSILLESEFEDQVTKNVTENVTEKVTEKRTLTDIIAELDRLDVYCEDQDLFEDAMVELKDKVEAIIQVLRRMDNRIQELSADISELTKIKKTIENKRDHLESYLKTSLQAGNFTQLSTDKFEVKLKPSTALVVDKLADSLDLTREDIKPYVVCKTSYQFDKNKIKDDIKLDMLPEQFKPYFYISSDKNLNFKFRR